MVNLKLNQEVYFDDEKQPMKVLAVSDRFAVCFREENETPYFLNLDFIKNIRNKEPFIFKRIDGDYQKFCDLQLKELEEGKSEINKRNCRELNIDWKCTKNV
ncbi:hypothetical protein LPB90_18375 [Chryseobacterium sp. LC2016-29]|uniref:hypothetical protein n=1 Tax=Chryseobacterium sp. LC2016-29 TaxID=2897331 RepID=UPI001E2CD17F|nr:hypothetical protein [Chryseobacterium sp. LC2016-29]MCD0480409.1 hypothetical protein [Chryseobacterium sp. LC2016-29]